MSVCKRFTTMDKLQLAKGFGDEFEDYVNLSKNGIFTSQGYDSVAFIKINGNVYISVVENRARPCVSNEETIEWFEINGMNMNIHGYSGRMWLWTNREFAKDLLRKIRGSYSEHRTHIKKKIYS